MLPSNQRGEGQAGPFPHVLFPAQLRRHPKEAPGMIITQEQSHSPNCKQT